MTKLTLSVEESVVKKAKRVAAANNTSVSAMFSRFVESAAIGQRSRSKIGPLTQKLSGVVQLPQGKDYKEILAESLAEKHGVSR
jgi:hypothetical protein